VSCTDGQAQDTYTVGGGDGGLVALVADVGIGAVLQQQLDEGMVALAVGDVQGRIAAAGDRLIKQHGHLPPRQLQAPRHFGRIARAHAEQEEQLVVRCELEV
jgi:hypothetical protein